MRVLQSKSCVLPWIGQCIQNPGKVTPCCRFVNAGHTMGWVTVGGTGKKLSEYHHRMPQRHFMQDRYPDHCVKCKIEDEQGVKSMRQQFNEIYDDVDTSKITAVTKVMKRHYKNITEEFYRKGMLPSNHKKSSIFFSF